MVLSVVLFMGVASTYLQNKWFVLKFKFKKKMLQNLVYFMYKKTHVVFFFFHFEQLSFFPYECLVYVDIDQGIHKGKSKVARNEKRKNYMGFLIHKI